MALATRLVRDGVEPISGMDRWLAALSPAGRASAAAEAITWATRLWCALDWSALGTRPIIGRDRWWDSPHSALLALRSRAEVRAGHSHLVLLSGPRRDSVRAELALVTLVESLRAPTAGPPGRVVGWWPDSGHTVRIEPEPRVALARGRRRFTHVGQGGIAARGLNLPHRITLTPPWTGATTSVT